MTNSVWPEHVQVALANPLACINLSPTSHLRIVCKAPAPCQWSHVFRFSNVRTHRTRKLLIVDYHIRFTCTHAMLPLVRTRRSMLSVRRIDHRKLCMHAYCLCIVAHAFKFGVRHFHDWDQLHRSNAQLESDVGRACITMKCIHYCAIPSSHVESPCVVVHVHE